MDTTAMQKRFHALGSERAAILAKSEPAKAKREALRAQVQALEAQIKPLNAEIKAVEAPLYGIDMERAALARSLGGKTGTPGA